MSHHAITIGNATLITGDCRAVLPTLPDASVQCVVTSPPYLGLRDYGTGTWAGGDPSCRHRLDTEPRNPNLVDVCCQCGAVRTDAQIGLEPSPDAYVAELVAVFREVRRVLRPDGVCFLNLGDSYSSGNSGQRVRDTNGGFQPGLDTRTQDAANANPGRPPILGHKPKDLLMMPARVALALQADEWWLRSDIIWAKPNPMPESVTDRPTSAHEHVFLLTKSARYVWDADAVREDAASADRPQPTADMKSIRPNDTPWHDNRYAPGASGFGVSAAGRNIRNVWTIATEAYPDSHFATMPTALVERCIKAGCPEGGTVLDPFSGAGTTALVADRLRRHAIGIELSAAYIALSAARLRSDAGLFAAPVTPAPEPPAPGQWVLL